MDYHQIGDRQAAFQRPRCPDPRNASTTTTSLKRCGPKSCSNANDSIHRTCMVNREADPLSTLWNIVNPIAVKKTLKEHIWLEKLRNAWHWTGRTGDRGSVAFDTNILGCLASLQGWHSKIPVQPCRSTPEQRLESSGHAACSLEIRNVAKRLCSFTMEDLLAQGHQTLSLFLHLLRRCPPGKV